MAVKRGQFVVFEGPEGGGKSTQLKQLANELQRAGVAVEVTREPGGTPLAERIRALLVTPDEQGMDSITELLLVFAARAEHLKRKIEPALASGKWVLCDRFTDSTYAYQGAGRGLDVNVIATLEKLVQQSFRPDWVVVLDIPIEQGMARANKRGALDRFEQEQQVFFERIRTDYLARAKRDEGRYTVIDAAGAQNEVTRSLLLACQQRYPELSLLSEVTDL